MVHTSSLRLGKIISLISIDTHSDDISIAIIAEMKELTSKHLAELANRLKRKEPGSSPAFSSKRAKTSVTPSEITPFRLFDLPAELRNLIYEKAAENQHVTIRSPTVSLTDRSGLLVSGDQLRNEYLPILLLHAPKITVKICNFDFTKVTHFLNHLSDAEATALPNTTKPTARKVEVALEYGATPEGTNQRNLKRWLNRFSHPAKKGTTLDTTYYFHLCRSIPTGAAWIPILDTYIANTSCIRSVEEARKIKHAINNPVPESS